MYDAEYRRFSVNKWSQRKRYQQIVTPKAVWFSDF